MVFGAVQSCSYLFVGVDFVVEEHGDVDIVGVRTPQTFRQTVTLGPREQVRGILHSHVEELTGSLSDGCRQVVHGVLGGEDRFIIFSVILHTYVSCFRHFNTIYTTHNCYCIQHLWVDFVHFMLLDKYIYITWQMLLKAQSQWISLQGDTRKREGIRRN